MNNYPYEGPSPVPPHFGRPDEEEEEDPLFGATAEQDGDASGDELYAILNLPRDCTPEDIQKSFKRLAALLHPDRHVDPALKSSADSRFQAIQRAHEVLSDPRQRAIYDELGEAGLASNSTAARTNWDVGHRTMTPQELRQEFEKSRGKQREAKVESLVKSTGELTCTTDARVLFLPDEERKSIGGPTDMSLVQKLATISTRQMFLKHSFTTPITDATSVVFTSQLLSRQGAGGGNMIVKLLTRPTSTLSMEIGTTVLRPRALTFKGTFSPDLDTFGTLEFPVRTAVHPPPFTLTLGRRIAERITATFTIRSGIYALGPWGRASLEPVSSSTVALGLISQTGYSLTATTGLISSSLSGDWGTTALGGVKIRVGGSVDTNGAVGTYVTGERRVTELSRVSFGVQTDVGGMMTAKISWMRLGQKITLPVIVSSTLRPTLIISFTVLPTISVMAINHWIVYPRKRKRLSGRIAEMRKEHSEFIREKRKEAEDAVALLAESSRKKAEAEGLANGLVILEAAYGVLDSSEFSFDVTIPVQSLVTNSQLTIVGGRSKSSLLGFFDCAMGEKKSLRVKYLFKGREHVVEVGDREGLAAPVRAHLVQ